MSPISKSLSTVVFVGVLAVCGVAAQQSNGSMTASHNNGASGAKPSAGTAMADFKFMKDAAQGGMAEVALGQLAVEKASSGDVKKFGQRMVDDHTKDNDELKQLASQKNVDLPQGLNARDKATKATLEKLSGEQFDQAYMKDMVRDHRKDISDFRRESRIAQDPDVKKFAAQTLPTLEDHLKQAESIAPPVASAAATH
jgi:putative membrane protein